MAAPRKRKKKPDGPVKYNSAGNGKSDKPCIAYRFRCYPTQEQAIFFAKTFGCCRFLWNQYVDDESYFYKVMGRSLDNTPADYKEDYPFLTEVDNYALCNVQLRYQRAMQAFFKGNSEYPKFKKKGFCRDSYTTNFCKDNIELRFGKLKLPKLPGKWLKLNKHRYVPENLKLKSATVTRKPDGSYYVSILYEEEATATPIPLNSIDAEYGAIGLDMSMKELFVASNGFCADYPRYYRESEEKLAKEQRKLSRMQKGSKNYGKQKLKVAKAHADIKHRRKDFLEKLSSYLVRNYSIICIEDLDMHGMAQSLNLGKSVMDNGWGMFVGMLEKKAARAGKYVIKVDKWFPSSQLCHCCGYKNLKVKDLGIREWTCPSCGEHLDRDQNAALNILHEGLYILFGDDKMEEAA